MSRYNARHSTDPAEREAFSAIKRAEEELVKALAAVRHIAEDNREASYEERRRRRPVEEAVVRALRVLRDARGFRPKPEPDIQHKSHKPATSED